MATFNGHKNWNHWNVSLWINNDESLYRTAVNMKENYPGLTNAVGAMLYYLKSTGQTKTPDGAPYSKSSVRAAIKDI